MRTLSKLTAVLFVIASMTIGVAVVGCVQIQPPNPSSTELRDGSDIPMSSKALLEMSAVYASPAGYAVSDVPFAAATSVDEDYRQQFTLCDEKDMFRSEAMNGYRRCSNDPNRLKSLLKFPDGTIFFDAKLAVDADGGYRACAGSGGATNLCPTSYVYRKARGWSKEEKAKRWQEAYATSDLLPYVVLPISAGNYKAKGSEFSDKTKIKIGDVGVIVYRDKIVPVLVADGGPHNKIGEGSLAAFDAIGETRCRTRLPGDPRFCAQEKDFSLDRSVLTFLFPNSGISDLTPETAEEKIRTKALSLFATLKAQ